jgi:hypothetical protein
VIDAPMMGETFERFPDFRDALIGFVPTPGGRESTTQIGSDVGEPMGRCVVKVSAGQAVASDL